MLKALIRLLPDTPLKFLKLVSTRETRHLSNVGDMAKQVARTAFSRRMGNDDGGNRDLVDVLGRSSMNVLMICVSNTRVIFR